MLAFLLGASAGAGLASIIEEDAEQPTPTAKANRASLDLDSPHSCTPDPGSENGTLLLTVRFEPPGWTGEHAWEGNISLHRDYRIQPAERRIAVPNGTLNGTVPMAIEHGLNGSLVLSSSCGFATARPTATPQGSLVYLTKTPFLIVEHWDLSCPKEVLGPAPQEGAANATRFVAEALLEGQQLRVTYPEGGPVDCPEGSITYELRGRWTLEAS